MWCYPIPFARASATRQCEGLDRVEQNTANALVTRLDDTISLTVNAANRLSAASLSASSTGGPAHVSKTDTGSQTGTPTAAKPSTPTPAQTGSVTLRGSR